MFVLNSVGRAEKGNETYSLTASRGDMLLDRGQPSEATATPRPLRLPPVSSSAIALWMLWRLTDRSKKGIESAATQFREGKGVGKAMCCWSP